MRKTVGGTSARLPNGAVSSPQVAARRRAWRDLVLSLYRRAMYIREAKLGASSPQLAATMTNLSVQLARGDAEELADAERLLRRGMQIRREVYGEEHPEVAHSLHLLANLYATQGSNPGLAYTEQVCCSHV